MRVLGLFAVFLIKIYRVLTCNRLPCCRFVPSCSAYAIEAIQKHGILKGGLLSLKRILRCRPHFRHICDIYDPVP